MLRLLFTVVALDLFLGGGGRLVEIGPVTLRMVMFGAALAATAVWFAGRPGGLHALDGGERLALLLVAGFALTHAGPAAIGWFDGQEPGDIGLDLKPMVFVAIAPFFALCLKTVEDAQYAARLLRVAAVVLALAYLATWGGLRAGLLDFGVIYPLFNDTGEFFFRGESFFFYKGFLYLGVGLVFLLAWHDWRALPAALLVIVALVLTLTRGFVLSTSIAVLALLAFRDRRALVAAMPLVAAATLVVLAWLPELDAGYLDQRSQSNAIRQDDFAFFMDHARPSTWVTGEGFGAWFNGRLLFENTWLWLVWKAGLPALAFWLVPFALATRWFAVALRSPGHRLSAAAWWCSVLLVYVQTTTNPFLNNPIGMSIVLMAVFALRAIAIRVAHDEWSAPAADGPPVGAALRDA